MSNRKLRKNLMGLKDWKKYRRDIQRREKKFKRDFMRLHSSGKYITSRENGRQWAGNNLGDRFDVGTSLRDCVSHNICGGECWGEDCPHYKEADNVHR